MTVGNAICRGALVAAMLAMTAALVAAPASPARADFVRDREYWLSKYGFDEAWQTSRGAGVTVAVVDTGVDGSVPELQGAMVAGADMSGFGSPDGQTPVGQNSDHGTLVASMIAGRGTGQDSGVIGVAPETSIMPISVTLGDESVDSDSQIADAVRWAADHGADVINLSFTRNSLGWPTIWDDAFAYALGKGIVIVAAAGNRGAGTAEVGAPATIPGVVAVAGLTQSGRVSDSASSQGATIAVSAPSENLVGVRPGGAPVVWNGTSGAAPLVSGLVALIRSSDPSLGAHDVINRLITTARPIGDGPVPGPVYGYGAIQAAAAVTASPPHVQENPLGSLTTWIETYRPSSSTPSPVTIPAPQPAATARPQPFLLGAPSLGAVTGFLVPAALLIGFALVIALLVWAAIRYFRRALRR